MITGGLGGYNIILGGYAGGVGEIVIIYHEIIRLFSMIGKTKNLESRIGDD